MGRTAKDDPAARAVEGAAPVTVDLDDVLDAPELVELATGSEVVEHAELVAQLAREELDALLRAYLRDVGDAPKLEPEVEPKVEIVLYVIERSAACAAAHTTLLEVLRRYDARDVVATIRNLTREPRTPDDDPLYLVPTLVVRGPQPVTMVGEIDVLGLEAMIARAGARPRSR